MPYFYKLTFLKRQIIAACTKLTAFNLLLLIDLHLSMYFS